MNSNKTNKLKLLIVGAFVAFSQFTYAQSIKVEQYETSSGSTFLVEYGSFFSLANSQRICQQDSVKLTATGFSGSTITWTTPNSTTIIGASIWVDESGSYSVSDGTSTASTSLNQSSFAPGIYSNEYPVSESTSEYDVDDTTSSTPGGFIPLFQSTEKHKWLTPESRQSAYSKMQFMMTAKELLDFGFEEGTILNEIGFNYTDEYYECNTSGHNFQIRVYEITDTTLTGFETTNSNYLGSFSCGTRSEGWNYFGIGDYQWNGTANLVFEFDGYTNGGSTSPNPEIEIKETPSNRSVLSVYGQSITSSTPSYSIDYRPLVSFKYKRPARQDSIIICDGSSDLYVSESASNYSWASSSGVISTDSYLSNHSNGGSLYLTASESGSLCKYIDTTEIIFNNLATPTVSASSVDFCEGETVTLSTSSTVTVDFVWSNGAKGSSSLVSNGGDYTVTATDEFGCSKTSSEITITEISKPALLKSLAASAVYNNETHTLQAGNGISSSLYGLLHLFDFGGKKYFVDPSFGDSANYVDIVTSNPLAEIGVIQTDAINDVFMAAHKAKRNKNSSFPNYIFTGSRWNSSTSSPVWMDGSTSSYNDYHSTPSNNDYYFYHYYNNTYWDWTSNFHSSWAALIAYDNSSLALQNGEVVCDSIELFAPSSFSSYTWSTGETTQSIWVSGVGSHSISLTGTYVKSDGSSCSLTSDTYTFTINPSPSLSITNNSSTVDLTGSNYIDLEAVYTSGASILWSTGVTGDTVNIYSSGDYSVTASLNGCSTTQNVQVYEPIYVAKTGNNTTGDGSFSSPYLTIQKGIDVAIEGQKIYVLPGTYSEGELDFETSSGVYKSVYLASDLVRTGDSTAIAGTKIDADGDGSIINIRGSNSSVIQGFTLTGQETSAWESSVIYLSNAANLQFKNIVIKGNTWVQDARAHCLGYTIVHQFLRMSL